MASTYDTISVCQGERPLVLVGADDSSLSDGCGHVWGIRVPSWHNDVRYYRDVCAKANLSVWRETTCATCDGMGRVSHARDLKKPSWARRMRPCPKHVPTHRTPESVYAVPTLRDVLAEAGR